jgi:hypothetical protein
LNLPAVLVLPTMHQEAADRMGKLLASAVG